MRLLCRDCQTTMVVNDKRLKLCPQCSSSNVEIILNGSKRIYQNRLREEYNERKAKEAEKLKKHFRFDLSYTICSICIVVIAILIIVSGIFGSR